MTDAEQAREQFPPLLQRGQPAPWFHGAALSGEQSYAFNAVAGRHVVMLFFGSTRIEGAAEALAIISRDRSLFDDRRACFFGVTTDPADAKAGKIAQQLPGIRFFLDYDRAISTAFGAALDRAYRPQWLVLDRTLRILGVYAIGEGERALALLRNEIAARPEDDWAPVLNVTNVLPTDVCTALIHCFEDHGGETSGFVREVGGKSVIIFNPAFKQRRDWTIDDAALRENLRALINRNLLVPLERAFQFKATRIERYLVARYDEGAGHFRAHRDNTTGATAHRRFAVTINLNAGEYDGGDLRFPEFGQRTYRAATGGAIVFSCSLLHEATPVTRGRRYAFLPFLYDDEAARQREANNAELGEGIAPYSGA